MRGLSRDPKVGEAYLADPRIKQAVTLRLLAELMLAARAIESKAGEIEVPTLLLHGEEDPLCRVEGSRRFHSGLRPSGSELRTYPGLLHEILNEPEWEQVLSDMHAWVEKQLGTGSEE